MLQRGGGKASLVSCLRKECTFLGLIDFFLQLTKCGWLECPPIHPSAKESTGRKQEFPEQYPALANPDLKFLTPADTYFSVHLYMLRACMHAVGRTKPPNCSIEQNFLLKSEVCLVAIDIQISYRRKELITLL